MNQCDMFYYLMLTSLHVSFKRVWSQSLMDEQGITGSLMAQVKKGVITVLLLCYYCVITVLLQGNCMLLLCYYCVSLF